MHCEMYSLFVQDMQVNTKHVCILLFQGQYNLLDKFSRHKSENYRPVSLTSAICKLLKMLIKDHMMDFLVRHKLLNLS